MDREVVLDLVGEFSWSFGETFFIETSAGNWVWSDPDYQGDNTLTRWNGTHEQWCKAVGIPWSRDKGKHRIRDYCGDAVHLVDPAVVCESNVTIGDLSCCGKKS